MAKVPEEDETTAVLGRFLNRQVPFFRNDASSNPATICAWSDDLQDMPGVHELAVEVISPREQRRLGYSVLVIKEEYPVQHLTLPKDKADLDEECLVRVKAEQELVRTALEQISQERFWTGNFVQPVLHWGVRVNGAPVDPLALVNCPSAVHH